jgi:hypothetical protein
MEGVKVSGGGTNGTLATASLIKHRIYPWAIFHAGVPALNDFGQVIVSSAQQQQIVAPRKPW